MDPAREALIVAIADYQDPKLQRLRAPAADAEALSRVLADPSVAGFRVELALDEDESALSRRLARFFSNRRPDDLLLVHFSCHGVKDASGELYIAASDTETDLLSATGIPSRWLNEQISQCRSKRIVVLLDCCFSGSFPFGVRTRAGEQVNVQEHLLGRGRVVITASNAMEYSFEGEELSGAGQPSIFTRAVVEGLATGEADRDGDRLVSVDELYEYVYDRVRETTPNQSPTKLSSLEGPLYIARSSYERPVEPVGLPQDLVDLTHHPYAEARLGAIAELATLLGSNNRGIGLSARLALEEMVNDDSRRVSERARDVLIQQVPEAEAASRLATDAATDTALEPEVEAAAEPAARPEAEPAARPEAKPELDSKPVSSSDGERVRDTFAVDTQASAFEPAPPFIATGPQPVPVAQAQAMALPLSSLHASDRQRLARVAAAGIAATAIAEVIGSLLSMPTFKSGAPGSGKFVVGFAIAALPVVIALVTLSVLSRGAAPSPALAAVAVVLGAAVTSLAGLVHFSPAHPHMYFVAVYAVAGIGAGVASTLCRRDRQVVLIGIGIGVVAGALGGVMRPLKYAADPTSAWIAANVLATVISTAPLCLFIGVWPREPDSVSTHSVAAGKPNG